MTKGLHPKLRRLRKLNQNLAAKRLQEERGGAYRQRIINKGRHKALTKRQYEDLQHETREAEEQARSYWDQHPDTQPDMDDSS